MCRVPESTSDVQPANAALKQATAHAGSRAASSPATWRHTDDDLCTVVPLNNVDACTCATRHLLFVGDLHACQLQY